MNDQRMRFDLEQPRMEGTSVNLCKCINSIVFNKRNKIMNVFIPPTCCAYPCAAGVALSGTLLTMSTSAGDSSAKRRPHATRVRQTETPGGFGIYKRD